MKRILQIILILTLVIPFSAKAGTFVGSQLTSSVQQIQTVIELSELTSATSSGSQRIRIFGIGKPKYNKRRIDRQNMPGPVFRRGRRIQRRNGLGYSSPRIVSPRTGILTINPLLL